MTSPSESTERVQTPLEVVSDEIYDAVAALDKDFAKHLYTADEGRLKLHALVFGYYRRGLDDGDNGLYGKDELAQEYSRGVEDALKALPNPMKEDEPNSMNEVTEYGYEIGGWNQALAEARENIEKLKEPRND